MDVVDKWKHVKAEFSADDAWVGSELMALYIEHMFQGPIRLYANLDVEFYRTVIKPKKKLVRTKLDLEKVYLMPFVVDNNHWLLAYIDNVYKHIMIYDPLKITTNDKYIEQFKEYFHTATGLTYTHTHIRDMGNPTQPNGYDCGVYVMHYIEQMLNSKPFEKQFNAGEYRKHIKGVIESEIARLSTNDEQK